MWYKSKFPPCLTGTVAKVWAQGHLNFNFLTLDGKIHPFLFQLMWTPFRDYTQPLLSLYTKSGETTLKCCLLLPKYKPSTSQILKLSEMWKLSHLKELLLHPSLSPQDSHQYQREEFRYYQNVTTSISTPLKQKTKYFIRDLDSFIYV